MRVREAFFRAREGDQHAAELMNDFAKTGSKEAERVLEYEVKRLQANSPGMSFERGLALACELYPDLHKAYLNSN